MLNLPHEFIRAPELRRLLGDVSPMWLWRRKDKLPKPVKIGNRRFYVKREIEEYLDRQIAKRDTELPPASVARKSKKLKLNRK